MPSSRGGRKERGHLKINPTPAPADKQENQLKTKID
jgi:hypothetical protein